MTTKPLFRNAFKIASYFFVFLWTAFSSFGQCPTITDPNPPPICDASGYMFSDLDAFAIDNGNGIVWYPTVTGGSAFNSNQLVVEGTYYADDNSGSCGSRALIVVNFQINKSDKNLDRIYCSNENATVQTYIDDVLQSTIPIGGSVEVYYDFNLSNQANISDPIPGGASNYFVVFVGPSPTFCKSQLEIGQVGVFNAPADPTPASLQEFCSVSNPVIGNLNPGTASTNFKWYENLDAFGEPIQPALSLLTPLVNGETYYIEIDDIFCVSNPIPVTVNIDNPVNPGIPGALEYCNDSLPTSDFNLFDELGGPKDATGSWSGPITTSNGNLGTVNISTLTTAGNYVFTYTVPSTGICPDATATVTITVYQTFSSGTPSAANPAGFCVVNLPSAFDLFSLLDNEDPNGQWTQGTSSSDPVITSPISLTGFTPGTYNFTYTQNLLPNPCPEESTTVQIIVLQDPNAGNGINQIFCENDLAANSPFDLFNALDGSQDNNSGIWRDASDATVSNTLDISSLNVAGSPYSFNYTIDNGSCFDTEIITITVEPAPESGTANAPIEFCEGLAPASFNLFDLLTGEDQTGAWFSGLDNLGASVTNPIDLSSFTPGNYNFTYDVDFIGSCDDVLVTVSVTINALPITGTPTAAVFCENDLAANSPLDLFGQLTGEDTGGTWTDDSTTGALSTSNVDLTVLTIGSYNFTYSITDVKGCTNSSTVIVTVEEAPESGTANAPIEFCEGLAPASFNLFDLLTGEDQTGAWFSGLDNLGASVTNPIDLSSFTPGNYNFTYDVDFIGSCDDVLVTVSVTINALPITGTPTAAVFCENDLAANSPLDLFGQLTGEDTGGTWTDDSTTGALSTSNVDLTVLTIGSYNFTYSITDVKGCTNSSTVIVTVEEAPESGTANTPIEFCVAEISTGQTFSLFDLLTGEDQTGVWSDDDATSALSGNLVAVDGLATGSYNFTYDVNALGSCDDVLVTVTIIINDTPSPTASTTQEFCDTATVSDLEATGTTIKWYDDATGGTALAGTVSLVNGETYYATQTDGSTGCESSVRTLVTATIYLSPNPGNPNTTPISACNNNNAIDLFTGLDGTQDAGGVWNNDDSAGVLTGNTFDATGVTAGTYQFTYLVSASAPCIDASITTTVTIDGPLNAGTNNTLDVCSNSGTTDLFTLIGSADTGGTWSPAMASGTGLFDPLVDAPATYTYTLTNACGTVSSDVVATVTLAPNAGTDNTAPICVIDGQTDLFPLLGTSAQSGGIWSPSLASGTGVFDPSVDTAGVYTYTVAAVSPCSPDSSAQITVSINDSPQIVVVDSSPSFCLVDNPTIADLSASIRPTGTVSWYTDATLATVLTTADALVNGEDYFATQTTGSGCESSVSVQINVTINNAPTPTLIDSNMEYCINDDPTINDLTLNITEYVASTNNVIWYDADVNGSVISDSSILTNLTTYYAALVDASSGCESSVRLTVTPDLTSCGVLRLPDGFSPNGDGVNDTYEVDNLAILYPNFEIEIYNRYGNLVYKGNASTPRFDGKSNQSRTTVKGDLPVGMYYYIFNFNDGENKPKQGHLYLSR